MEIRLCPVHNISLVAKETKFGIRYGCPEKICTVACWDGDNSTPADYETRKERSLAHIFFDPLWKSGKMKRKEAYKLLAKSEGVFCEPASAAAVAGIIKKDREGYFGSERKTAVAVLTGHGLKDPDRAIGVSELPVSLAANVETIAQAIGF